MAETVRTSGAAAAEAASVSAKGRAPEQDIAKGIAILLVVALHTLKLDQTAFRLLGGLFGFIMPFFFFMAGSNYQPGKYAYKEIIRRRVKQLVKPMITYSVSITVIAGAYLMLTGQYSLGDVVNDYLMMLLSRQCAGWIGITSSGVLHKTIMFFWFIQMLFVASLVFYAVVDYALSKASRFISITVGLTALTMLFAHFDLHLPFYLLEAPAIAAMMLFGALFGKHRLLTCHAGKRAIVFNCLAAYAIFLVLAAMFQGSGFIMGGYLWTRRLKEWDVLLSLVFSVTGSYAFVHACRWLVKTGPLCKALTWCGNNSMKLLFLHGIVQLFLCEALGMEPFRMSMQSEESDLRTFYVLALELLFTVLAILAMEYCKGKLARKKPAAE